ncbi:MAG TPA: DNA-directed RNA polymerase subunit beta' [Candidatus Paceibacterota bacterium]|nr:DNA-directed RNA polymerase subunit beta' [Candidatus Paceibacterota bacterium]
MSNKKTLPIKNFGKFKALIGQTDLNEIQLESYKWFLKTGLKELLVEVSPIYDHTGKELELYFEDYYFGEPKYDEATTRYKDATYEAPLHIRVRLTNKKTGRSETQEVYFGDFPKMTDRGTFIVNGVERVVVSQLIRSAGVYFTAVPWRDRQLFGAKVIPNRGAWLEFETDIDGTIGVKIDRHRKLPVTDLLRVFGVNEDEMRAAVADVDTGAIRYLDATLKKDIAKDVSESYLEIYRRLRPGDPANPQTAKSLVDSVFLRPDRYDLSGVGRFKTNQRLGFEKKKQNRLLDREDILAMVREIIRLNNKPDAEADDIDHLGNRRLKAVGELLQSRLRISLARLRRIVQDRMSTLDRENLMPAQLINFRPITAVVKEFFASSQLSQFMDQINPLAELEHKRRLSALGPGGLTRERASFEVRDVHRSHYGRICPIETPEGSNIGLINYLASYARINEYGFLETPYAKVKDGVITNEIVWLDALEEEKYRIVHAAAVRDGRNRLVGPIVDVRFAGTPVTCPVAEVELMDVAPHQFISVATSLIPFLQHDDANRALMGSNMQRQAVALVKPQAPYVGTGEEEKAASDSGYLLTAEAEGTVTAADARHIVVKYGTKIKEYPLEKFKRSNQFTCISQRPVVLPGQEVKKGDILADGPSIDNGTLALGQNLLVAFMSWEGANFEDAIILSNRVVREDFFTSIHVEEFYCDVRDTKLGPELTTPDIPNVSEEKLKNLNEDGIIRIGAEVKAGDILVGKISPKGEAELTAEERLLRAIFGEKARDVKDTSLTLPHGKRGRIVGIKVFSRDQGDKLEAGIIKRIQVEVADLRKVQAGDKLAGRHGNKGVISQVRPVEDMPYLADGTPVDIVLNPLGVASRMNLGQILETHLGWAAGTLGYRAVTPGLDSATEADIRGELKRAGLPEDGKVTLVDGRTGKTFDRSVTVGQIYMMKLNHLVEDKVHMRSIGPYSLITQQPLGGKAQFGGQRFGEMEVWALEGYGASYTLQEMLTIKSDDVLGRSAAYESIIRGEPIKGPNIPASFNVLVNELKALGLNIEPIYENETDHRDNFKALKISVASPDDMMKWSHGEVLKPETINYRTQRPEKDGLFSARIFGPVKDYECDSAKYRRIRYKGVVCDKCGVEVTRSVVRRERMGHIQLATPVAHIWFFKSVPSRLSLLLYVSSQKLERVIYYVDYIVTDVDEKNRQAALAELEKELRSKLKIVGEKDKKFKKELNTEAAAVQEFLETLRPGQVLTETEYFSLSRRFGSVFKAGTGAEAIREILEKMDLHKEVKVIEKALEEVTEATAEAKLLRRLKMLRSMIQNGARPEWLVMTTLPVLPPDLRPMVALDGGRYATSDLNDLYRRVINRNNRLKKLLEIKAPEVIVKNEKRMLQEAVDALIDNSARFGAQQMSAQRRPLRSLADMLKGKQGRFRQNLLGKRVDYSGRSVIVVGPRLKIDECGLPKKMALELFRPFVIGEMIRRELAHNIKMANRLIEQGSDEIWAILDEVIKDKRVLLNRAPTLHRLSIQSFRPVLIEGLAIQIPPLVCTAFNADFDGDQMAVHLPLSDEAQREARDIMSSSKNLLKPATGDLITAPTQDFVLGIYYLTQEFADAKGAGKVLATFEEALAAYDHDIVSLHAPVRVGALQTTVGRLIFNERLAGAVPYVNEPLNKKKLSKLIERIIESHDFEKAGEVIDGLKLLGFEIASRSGITWSIADLIIPPQKSEVMKAAEKEVTAVWDQYNQGFLTDAERRVRVISVWEKAKAEVAKLVTTVLPKSNSIYQIIDSGSRGSWAQPIQMMGMKGMVQNPKGEAIELPVRSSFKEGLSVLEYFISTHGARKGTTDTALKTAQAGYLTRRLVDVAQDLAIRDEDCRTKEGLELHREDGKEFGQTFASRLFSRTALEDIRVDRKVVVRAGEVIDKAAADIIEKSNLASIVVRSPIACKSLYGLCRLCYGYDLGVNRLVDIGAAVGVVAAQSIGEPGTQLTMRTFHTGGVAGLDITHGLPRVEELFEIRPPKGKAILAAADGEITHVEERGNAKIVILKTLGSGGRSKVGKKVSKKAKEIEYLIPRSALLFVKTGDKVTTGQQLSEGHIDLREFFEYRGGQELVRHIVNEVQRIYMGEGAAMNNKHIEVIVRQMFSRVKIKDAGDASNLVIGEIIEKSKFLETNRDLKKAGKKLAKAQQLLLGITRVALSTESFLSAASFQDTARVLVKAAIEGRVDPLRGLKENVIIGRLTSRVALPGEPVGETEGLGEVEVAAVGGEEGGESEAAAPAEVVSEEVSSNEE